MYLKRFVVWSRDKRALSPIFATVLLATIIIIFGSVAYYYSSNITTVATNNYVSALSDSQQSMTERISFENVVYDQSSTTLTVYIFNCGSTNNVKINSVFIYDSNHNIEGTPYSGSQILPLQPIDERAPTPTPITGNALNVGKEAFFDVLNVKSTSGTPLNDNSIYTIHLITQSGSHFDYDFSP
jgi:archaellum component FlaF (FlaF/FlaG flagellin family)